MDPDETSTTSVPRCRWPASASTSPFRRTSSTIPSGVVSELDPTLTTTRPAEGRSERRARALALIVLGRHPVPGPPLGGQLLSGLVTRRAPLRQGLPLGAAGRPLPLGEPDVGAARSRQQLGSGAHRWLPVEHDRALVGADDDLGAGCGAGLEQLLLHAEPGQPVREVPDGLLVGEVG